MYKKINPEDWLLLLEIDVAKGVSGLKKYRSFLKSLSKVSDKRTKNWIKAESKTVTQVISQVRNLKTRGPVYDTLNKVGNRLYNSVLATWRAEMTPRTYRYLNSIKRSEISKIDDSMMVGVGNWKRMMASTPIYGPKIKEFSIVPWVKSKYGLSREMSTAEDKILKQEKQEGRTTTYVATKGPLKGQQITGYFYLQEAGFTNTVGKFVHHPVFSAQPMETYQDEVEKIFGNKIYNLLKRSFRYAKWSAY